MKKIGSRPAALGTAAVAVLIGSAGMGQAAAQAGPAAFVACPVEQPQARNGTAPSVELVKRIIRCRKGEKSVPPGQEGAVQVEVATVRIGAPRPWSYRLDTGSGTPQTRVYPVRATYTMRTLYRAATEVEEGWIRVLNFYVDSFGEWQIGSEEPVKPGTFRRIPKR